MSIDQIREYLGEEADFLLNHTSTTIPKDRLFLPSNSFVDDVFGAFVVDEGAGAEFGDGEEAGPGDELVLPPPAAPRDERREG